MAEQTVAVTFGEGTDGDTWSLVFAGLGGTANPHGYVVTINNSVDMTVSYIDGDGIHGWDETTVDSDRLVTVPLDEVKSIFVY